MDASGNNNNVGWVGGKGVWFFYVLIVLAGRGLLAFLPGFPGTWAGGWTCVHLLHAAVQFVGLHWNRGTPIQDDQGEYNDLTFWEQIDGGRPWTSNRKWLLTIPVVLFLVTCHATEYAWEHFVVNCPVVLILVVSKLPEMHRVRLFGLNKAVGID